MSFKENLRQYRETTGLTAKDFATLIGIKYSTYISYEAAGKEPKYDTLQKIAAALHVSIDELLGYKQNKADDGPLAEADDLPSPDTIKVEVYIPGEPPQKLWMDRYNAENMAAGFRQHNKPTFACNLPDTRLQHGGLWEVDLRQVSCITTKGLKLPDNEKVEEQEEDYRLVPSYKNRSRSQGWKRGNVTCHNCGADYETDINEKWAYVKCKYCHESDTTVTYESD